MTPDELAALCDAAMPEEHLTAGELAYLLLRRQRPGRRPTRSSATSAAPRSCRSQRFGEHVAAWLVLVAVHPDRQSTGRGKELVERGDRRVPRELGAHDVLLASAVPRYLWPGVDTANTRAGMLLETLGFERDWVGTNMAIPTSFRRDAAERRRRRARRPARGAHDFAAESYPHWVPELDRVGAARDRVRGPRTRDGAHDRVRVPFGQPGRLDRADGHRSDACSTAASARAVLAALCADLEHRGIATGEISWVSNLRFYGKCGARVSRVFLGGR